MFIFISFSWIICIVLIFTCIIFTPYEFFINGTLILGWFLFAFQLTYEKSEKFYLLIKRFWFWFRNHECYWNMSVSMFGDFNRNHFKIIEEVFDDYGKDVNKIIPLSNTRKTYRLGSLNIEVSIDEYNGNIYFDIADYEVTYRRSREIIEKELCVLFELFIRTLNPKSDKYGLKVTFKKFNPYYGFFLRRLDAKDIQGFNVVIKADDEMVSVSKKNIEINSESLTKFNSIAKEYLALSPR